MMGGERGSPNSRVIPASVDERIRTDGRLVVTLSPLVFKRTGTIDPCADAYADGPSKNVSNIRIGQLVGQVDWLCIQYPFRRGRWMDLAS